MLRMIFGKNFNIMFAKSSQIEMLISLLITVIQNV